VDMCIYKDLRRAQVICVVSETWLRFRVGLVLVNLDMNEMRRVKTTNHLYCFNAFAALIE
jgi:hypothetical protein